MKKVIFSTLFISSSILAMTDYPDELKNGDYVNSNNRKVHTYEVNPELDIWYEFGRPYWKTKEFQKQSLRSNENGQKIVVERMENEDVYFPSEVSRLDSTDKKDLRDLARLIKRNSKNIDLVIIEGHASKPGSTAFNMDLSKDRAVEVKKFLVDQGIDEDLIATVGFGELFPENTKNKSRRVEISLIK